MPHFFTRGLLLTYTEAGRNALDEYLIMLGMQPTQNFNIGTPEGGFVDPSQGAGLPTPVGVPNQIIGFGDVEQYGVTPDDLISMGFTKSKLGFYVPPQGAKGDMVYPTDLGRMFGKATNVIKGAGGSFSPKPQRTREDIYAEIENSPEFQMLTQQGEAGILANASATGGLRGGNTQAALAKYRPQVLNSLIQQRMAHLQGLTGLGQTSAAGVAQSGLTTSGNIGNLYQDIGAYQAGGTIAQGQNLSNMAQLLSLYNDASKTSGDNNLDFFGTPSGNWSKSYG